MRKNSFRSARKKIIGALCSVALVAGLCPAVALADEGSKYTASIQTEKTWAVDGTTFDVVLASGAKDASTTLSCGQYTISYNSNIVSIDEDSITADAAVTNLEKAVVTPGEAKVSFFGNTLTQSNIATLKFKAKATGNPEIKITDAVAGASENLDDQSVEFSTDNLNVTVVKRFSDVFKSSSYYDIIYQAVAMGLIGGYSDGTFRPSIPLNRQQAAIMFYRAYGSETNVDQTLLNSMTDQATITNAEARNAIAWCANNGVVGGKTNKADGTKYYDPKGELTRQQLCTMVARAAANLNGIEVANADQTLLNSMTDQATITNAEARNAIAWCANNNIVGGKTNKADGTKYFDPKASATRAQFTKILVGAVTQNFLGK